MAKTSPYIYIVVESYIPSSTSGLHGEVHIRPVENQKYPQRMHVSCSKKLSKNYPVGTKFRIKVKLTDREGEGEYLFSHHSWPFDIVE